MKPYQKELIERFAQYRAKPTYAVYPPYHVGDYIEDYFFKEFVSRDPDLDRYYIPVSWTTCYNQTGIHGLQEELLKLDVSCRYFTLSQHDDAIHEKLPSNTLHFAGGGNGGGIPIPLICSAMPSLNKAYEKDILASFVGTISYGPVGDLRKLIYNHYFADKDFYFCQPRGWNPSVPQSQLEEFMTVTARSRFALCPRGYGAQSFRFYEAMQLNSIPVFIHTQSWFPFDGIIDWNRFAVRIHINDIHTLKNILTSISEEKQKQMLEYGREVYNKHFTMQGVCDTVFNLIK